MDDEYIMINYDDLNRDLNHDLNHLDSDNITVLKTSNDTVTIKDENIENNINNDTVTIKDENIENNINNNINNDIITIKEENKEENNIDIITIKDENNIDNDIESAYEGCISITISENVNTDISDIESQITLSESENITNTTTPINDEIITTNNQICDYNYDNEIDTYDLLEKGLNISNNTEFINNNNQNNDNQNNNQNNNYQNNDNQNNTDNINGDVPWYENILNDFKNYFNIFIDFFDENFTKLVNMTPSEKEIKEFLKNLFVSDKK